MPWASLLLGAAAWSFAGASPERDFVGAESCKLCHRQVYQSWLGTGHARTDRLPPDSDASCGSCHATEAASGLVGVQCEACHGPGADYSPAEVMIDRDKAVLAGLAIPDEAVCRRCHVAGPPGHPTSFSMPEPADVASAIHRMAPP